MENNPLHLQDQTNSEVLFPQECTHMNYTAFLLYPDLKKKKKKKKKDLSTLPIFRPKGQGQTNLVIFLGHIILTFNKHYCSLIFFLGWTIELVLARWLDQHRKFYYKKKIEFVSIPKLKAYSLMLNRGRSQNFQNLIFLHIFLAFLKKAHFPKGIRLKSS